MLVDGELICSLPKHYIDLYQKVGLEEQTGTDTDIAGLGRQTGTGTDRNFRALAPIRVGESGRPKVL